MKRLVAAVLVAAAAPGAAREASAQTDNWAPWLGCWERISHDIREPIQPPEGATPEIDAVARSAPRVCVVANGDGSVTMATTAPGQTPIEQTLLADGQPHPVSRNDCQGTERSEWSSSGRRLFSRADVTCGDGGDRAVSGLTLLTPTDVWLDIRGFEIDGWPTTRVSRYRRANAELEFTPSASHIPLTLSEIKEAGSKVSGPVLEAAIAETNPRVTINRRTLVELADAGVSPQTLDVMVALAYPEKFIVERSERQSGEAYFYSSADVMPYPAYYYYSPFAYSYIGWYPPPYQGGGGGRPIGPPAIDSGTARAINNQGYTRIRPNEAPSGPSYAVPREQAVDRSSASSAPSSADSGGGSAGGASSGGGSSGGSSGGGGSASPDGFRGGGGSADTARTAVPR